ARVDNGDENIEFAQFQATLDVIVPRHGNYPSKISYDIIAQQYYTSMMPSATLLSDLQTTSNDLGGHAHDRPETSPPKTVSARRRWRCRTVCHVPDRLGASLSNATGSNSRWLSSRRCSRHDCSDHGTMAIR